MSLIKKIFYLVTACNIAGLLFLRNPLNALITFGGSQNSRDLRSRSTVDNLVVFDAVGKKNNLALIEHSRRTAFKQDEWDCVIFMYAVEDKIANENEHLKNLQKELGCSVPRMPGVAWGDFLQFLTPTFVDNYDYIALVLDDMFIPDQGDHPFDAAKLIEQMKENNIDIISPAVIADTWNFWERAANNGWDECLVEIDFIETFVQFFSRDAWGCYYNMLHYSGRRGFCYDVCLKEQCPDLKMAQDNSQFVWHLDAKKQIQIPPDRVQGTILTNWTHEENELSQGFYVGGGGWAICIKLGCNSFSKEANGRPFWIPELLTLLTCPAHKNMNNLDRQLKIMIDTSKFPQMPGNDEHKNQTIS